MKSYCRPSESFEKDDFAVAISNAGKSYESVLKVICNCQKGNADRLTRAYVEMKGGILPASMDPRGISGKKL